MTNPTYEELRGPARAKPNGLVQKMREMAPGDVLDITDISTAKNPSNSVGMVARSLGLARHFATRTRDGRRYVIRFRQEDVRA